MARRGGLITIAADLPNLESIIRQVERAGKGDGLHFTKEAVKTATTEVVQRKWIEYASGVQVNYSGGTFKVNTVTGAYLRSIQDGVRFPESLTGEVFSTSPHAGIIEDGQDPRDMKEALLNGPKAKVGKNGKRYTTVPFRHGIPGTQGINPMPQNVYNEAKRLQYSRRNNMLQKIVGFAKTGQWKKYTWGGRLGYSAQGGMSHVRPHFGAGYSHKTGRFSGMVRMGAPGHSEYMTFRRVSENSDPKSWRHPGVKPKPIRDAVVENTREEVFNLIRNGFEMDLYFMGLGGER